MHSNKMKKQKITRCQKSSKIKYQNRRKRQNHDLSTQIHDVTHKYMT